MKKELKGLSDPTKFHEPLRLQGIDQKNINKYDQINDYYKKN